MQAISESHTKFVDTKPVDEKTVDMKTVDMKTVDMKTVDKKTRRLFIDCSAPALPAEIHYEYDLS